MLKKMEKFNLVTKALDDEKSSVENYRINLPRTLLKLFQQKLFSSRQKNVLIDKVAENLLNFCHWQLLSTIRHSLPSPFGGSKLLWTFKIYLKF